MLTSVCDLEITFAFGNSKALANIGLVPA
uniref:Uncharacterized protein n=1 Tax=Anguilla anguilla TaxID=7936 RepID=A0A0E9W161_ANGAN